VARVLYRLTSPHEHAGKGIEMMWQAASPVDLAACAATTNRAGMSMGMRRAKQWRSRGVSWRNG